MKMSLCRLWMALLLKIWRLFDEWFCRKKKVRGLALWWWSFLWVSRAADSLITAFAAHVLLPRLLRGYCWSLFSCLGKLPICHRITRLVTTSWRFHFRNVEESRLSSFLIPISKWPNFQLASGIYRCLESCFLDLYLWIQHIHTVAESWPR